MAFAQKKPIEIGEDLAKSSKEFESTKTDILKTIVSIITGYIAVIISFHGVDNILITKILLLLSISVLFIFILLTFYYLYVTKYYKYKNVHNYSMINMEIYYGEEIQGADKKDIFLRHTVLSFEPQQASLKEEVVQDVLNKKPYILMPGMYRKIYNELKKIAAFYSDKFLGNCNGKKIITEKTLFISIITSLLIGILLSIISFGTKLFI